MTYKTEYSFTLPRGLLDASGNLQRNGVMRLAYAQDEIQAVNDPRVQANQAYLPVALLSRVIVRLGEFSPVTPQMVESLFASDLAFLEDFYMRINSHSAVIVGAVCPQCGTHFHLQVAPLDTETASPGD